MLILQEHVINNEKKKVRRILCDPINTEFVATGTYYAQYYSKAPSIAQQYRSGKTGILKATQELRRTWSELFLEDQEVRPM